MTMSLGITLGAIIGLLILSGFFSGSETALTAASRAKMHALEEDGSKRARIVNNLLQIRERFIGAILLGNTLVNVAASALATSLFLTLFGERGVVYATIVMTVIVVLFAEVLPKTYAILNADRMALVVAPVVRLLVAVLAPVTTAMQWIVRHTLRLFGLSIATMPTCWPPTRRSAAPSSYHHRKAAGEAATRDMLGGVLDLRELTSRTSWSTGTTSTRSTPSCRPTRSSTWPWKAPTPACRCGAASREKIVGVLHAKTCCKALARLQGRSSKIDIMAHRCARPGSSPTPPPSRTSSTPS